MDERNRHKTGRTYSKPRALSQTHPWREIQPLLVRDGAMTSDGKGATTRKSAYPRPLPLKGWIKPQEVYIHSMTLNMTLREPRALKVHKVVLHQPVKSSKTGGNSVLFYDSESVSRAAQISYLSENSGLLEFLRQARLSVKEETDCSVSVS